MIVRFACAAGHATVLAKPPTDAPSFVVVLERSDDSWAFDRDCHNDVLGIAECIADLEPAVVDVLALVGETYALGRSEIDPTTWPAECATPAQRRGDTGVCVAKLQTLLVLAGEPIEVDGRFGPDTAEHLVAFQTAAAIEADGVAGPATWAALVDAVNGVMPGGRWIDGAAYGRPDPGLLDAVPADDIPWDDVGTDWFAFGHPRRTTTLAEQAGVQALYLVGPDDRIYAVSNLPADADVVSVSWTGRIALLRGAYASGLPLGVLDLETTVLRTVVSNGADLDSIALTRDGRGLWVYDLPWSNPPVSGGIVQLLHVDLESGLWTMVLEEAVEVDPLVEYDDWWVNNRGGVAELPGGEIVVGMPSGVWVGLPGGDLRRLDLPDARCSIAAGWDDTTVLVRCQTAELAICECGSPALWLVPADGRPATQLSTPPPDSCIGHSDAAPLDGHLAIDAGFGSGECNAHVLIVGPDGTAERWHPPLGEVDCNEWVVGVRNGAWLIQAANPYVSRDFPVALFEVGPTGTTQVDVPPVWTMMLTP